MNHTHRFIIPLLLFLFGASITQSQFLTGPHPGDIFREFTRYNSTWDPRDAYVTDPNTSNAQARADLPNHVLSLNVSDLQGAIRAELVIDHWAGHVGTNNRQFRFNNHSWITIPNLNAASGIPAGHSGQCYAAQYNPTVIVPLSDLVQGNNTFQGTSGGQTCYSFGWGTWGWYGVILRVYYGPSKAHATGSITSPAANSTVGENPTISSSASGAIQAQFLAYYDGIDYDGDGVHQEYHHSWHRGKSETSMNMKNHVGTDASAPFSATWNTDLVPEQTPGSIKFIARLKNSGGVYFITNEVTGVSLQRSGSVVRLYRANDMPERFWVRSGRSSKSTHMNIPSNHNLGTATSAKLIVATWNGNDVSEAGTSSMKINSLTLPDFGQDHYYSFDVLTILRTSLFNGNNTFTAQATTTQHGIEILWPGPALVVRYSASTGPTSPVITLQPQNQSVGVGQTATFTIAASGTAPLTFQWQKNSVNISGATSASYTTPATVIGDNGATFHCKVTNAYGNVTSNNATLTVGVGGGGVNVVKNPGFESGTASWTFYTSGAGSFSSVAPGSQGTQAARIGITTQGTNVQLYQSSVPLDANTAYKLTFTAYSNTSHDLSVSLLKQVSPYSSYGLDNFVANLTGGWQTFTKQFTTSGFSGTVNDGRLRFWFSPYDAAGDAYFIDEVILQKVSAEPGTNTQALDQPAEMPTAFGLMQNYPNPFNPSTTIRYELPEAAYVTLKVYDVIGREVATLVDAQQEAGRFEAVLNGQDLASGVYFYRIKAGNFLAMRRLLLLK